MFRRKKHHQSLNFSIVYWVENISLCVESWKVRRSNLPFSNQVGFLWMDTFPFMGEENVMIRQHRERNIKEKKIFQLFLVLEGSEKSLRIFCLFCKEFEKWANREFSYIVIAVVHGLQSFLSLNNIFPLFFNFFSFIQT